MKKIALLTLALMFMLAPMAFAQEEEAADEGGAKHFVNLGTTLLFNPKVAVEVSGSSASSDGEFSYGGFLGYEYYVWDYISVGGSIDFDIWNPTGGGDATNVIMADPVVKGLYAFGNKKEFEVYGKVGFGYAAFMLPKNPAQDAKITHGWNMKFMPGFMYNIGSWGIFAEMGYVIAKYSDSIEIMGRSYDYDATFSSLFANVGVGYKF